jgi:hypothetical protein
MDLPPPLAPQTIADWERLATERPDDAQTLVGLANAYWLEGRGPQLVDDLASRAKTIDPTNRGAWHLWALAESSPRDRVARWQHVTEHFPQDDLAKAALADNAASLAGAEHDPAALQLAIQIYEQLFQTARQPDQQIALREAINTLKGWRL